MENVCVPCKNVTWILMEIPCHLSSAYLLSVPEHDMDFGQVQVMECPWHLQRQRWDFHGI